MTPTTIFDIPTPSLILDRAKLVRNIRRMAEAAKSKDVTLRPHLKTAKSIDVARLAMEGQAGGVAVSTLKEAEYFASHGIMDIQYAVCILPDQLERVASIQQQGARLTLITDSVEVTRVICKKGKELGATFLVQVELDCGEGRSGVFPDSEEVIEIARLAHEASHARFAGVMTHAGHSYQCRSIAEIEEVAEMERSTAVMAAERIRDHGIPCTTVSIGSTPTALYARSLDGVTEVRPGVYMFGDMFQAQINSCGVDDLAVSVITEVCSHHASLNRLLINAGALALSKDRSTEHMPDDVGFGLVTDARGAPLKQRMKVARVYQEHGQVPLVEGDSYEELPVGTRLRVYPNHVCMTAAMYNHYYLVDSNKGDGCEIIATWPRINGW